VAATPPSEPVARAAFYLARAKAGDPVNMARAFALAVEAGRIGYRADLMQARDMAAPSTPVIGRAFSDLARA